MLREHWYTVHGRDFFPGTVLCSALKIINASDALLRLPEGFKIKLNGHWMLTPGGIIQLIQSSAKLTAEEKQALVKELFNLDAPIILTSRKETEFMAALCKILDTMNIKYVRQYPVLNYKLDLYLPQYNICVEYDEAAGHRSYDQDKEMTRTMTISEYLQDCLMIRLNDYDDMYYSIGKVMQEILAIGVLP